MKSTLDAILAILYECGVSNYYLTADTGYHCMIEIAYYGDSYRRVKIICGFHTPFWGDSFPPTGVMIHICSEPMCCKRPRHRAIPDNALYGTLEDPVFYDYLAKTIDKCKIEHSQAI
jgi:hypothetical protein